MSAARALGAGLLFLGLALGVASTALDYWYYYSVSQQGISVSFYMGLWEFCVKTSVPPSPGCKSWSSFQDLAGGQLDMAWLHGCQAMMIIGCALNVVAAVAVIFATVKHTSVVTVQGVAVASAICYIIAAAIFGAKYEENLNDAQVGGHLHVGFALAIIAAVVNFVPVCVLATPSAREPANPGGFGKF